MTPGPARRKRKAGVTKSGILAQRLRTTSPKKNAPLNTSAISTRSKQTKRSNDKANGNTDIQISKVESINEDLFKKSDGNEAQEEEDDDCMIIEGSPVEIIDLVDKSACRVCLNESCNEMIPLASNMNVERNEILLSECLAALMKKQQIFKGSDYPDCVCMDCFHRVINAYLLLTQLEKVEAKFQAMYLRKTNPPTISQGAKISKPDADDKTINKKSVTPEKTSKNNGNPLKRKLTDDTSNESKAKQLRDASKVKCLECNIQMNVNDIGKHLRTCKKNYLATNLPNGRCKVLVCKLCNTLVFVQNMKMHSQVCKKDKKPLLNKQEPNSSNDNSNTSSSEQKQVRKVEPIGSIAKDEVIEKPTAIIAKATGQVFVNSPDSTRQVVIQRFRSPGGSTFPVLREKNNSITIQRVPDSTFKNTSSPNMQSTGAEPKIKDAPNAVVSKVVSSGKGLHPLEKEIRMQLMNQYMYACKECLTSFISLESLNVHNKKFHQVSSSMDIAPKESAPSM